MNTPLVTHQLIRQGLAALDDAARDYLMGGAESETTIAANRAALDRQRFVPRVLRDVRHINMSVPVLGKPAAMPVVLAPVGGLDRFCANGGIAAGNAASIAGVPITFGSLDLTPLDQLRAASSGTAIYQLYIRGDAHWLSDRVAEVQAAGFDAICFTVDSAVYSRRERDLVHGRVKPNRAAMAHSHGFTWDSLARVMQDHDVPVVLKGVAAPQDAARAVEMGVKAIYVSNHGGRQLDHTAASLDLLPPIVDAVAGEAQIIMDGGVQRGTDIIKACALGAQAVGIGRLYCLALAAAGQAGVTQMLTIIADELRTSLGLLGVPEIADLSPDHLVPTPDPVRQDVFSTFPCLRHRGSDVDTD